MKGNLFGFACFLLWSLSTSTQEAHHPTPSKRLTMAQKGQHSNNKTSYSTLKNITQPKVPINQNKPQKSQSGAATVHNALAPSNSQASKIAVSTLGRVLGHAQASQAQATGRAILVHNVNDEVKHVVQGSTSERPSVIVVNPDSSKGSLDPFSQDCLDAHNNYRAKHGVPPLMWSRDLAEGAQAWADQLASTDSLQHDQVATQNHKIGENLAYFQPAVPKCEGAMVDNCVNCREMVQRWYGEVKNYDFDKGGPNRIKAPYRHFSQLIWADTSELGVGTAVSKRFGFITVARYRPSGNGGGAVEFTKNVPPEGGPLPSLTPQNDGKEKSDTNIKPASLASQSTVVSSIAPTFTATPSASVLPSKKTNQDVPERVGAQSIKTAIKIPAKNASAKSAKPAVLVPTKSASASIPAAPKQVGAKIDNHTPDQPITKGARAKGGFVHTLTANDGAKAQVYLSKNGAHAGIVFRNKIFRVSQDEDSSNVKRTIYVM